MPILWNPLHHLQETKHSPLSRLFNSSIVNRLKDAFWILFGADPSSKNYTAGITDYLLLGLPFLITREIQNILYAPLKKRSQKVSRFKKRGLVILSLITSFIKLMLTIALYPLAIVFCLLAELFSLLSLQPLLANLMPFSIPKIFNTDSAWFQALSPKVRDSLEPQDAPKPFFTLHNPEVRCETTLDSKVCITISDISSHEHYRYQKTLDPQKELFSQLDYKESAFFRLNKLGVTKQYEAVCCQLHQPL